MSDPKPLTPEEIAWLRGRFRNVPPESGHPQFGTLEGTITRFLATLDAERAVWDGMVKEHARLVDEVNAVRIAAKAIQDRLDDAERAARPDDIYPGPSFIDGLLARCGVYWGEDPMADPDDERRHWWMGTDGAGSVWAIEDEITIALIQQFTRVLANVAARMGIAAEQDALAAPAPALDGPCPTCGAPMAGGSYAASLAPEWNAEMRASYDEGFAAERASRPDAFAWLVERGQSMGQVPTVWLDHSDEWTTDAWAARRFDTREECEAFIEARSGFAIPSHGHRFGVAVQHGFAVVWSAPQGGKEPTP